MLKCSQQNIFFMFGPCIFFSRLFCFVFCFVLFVCYFSCLYECIFCWLILKEIGNKVNFKETYLSSCLEWYVKDRKSADLPDPSRTMKCILTIFLAIWFKDSNNFRSPPITMHATGVLISKMHFFLNTDFVFITYLFDYDLKHN